MAKRAASLRLMFDFPHDMHKVNRSCDPLRVGRVLPISPQASLTRIYPGRPIYPTRSLTILRGRMRLMPKLAVA
jgi:hypothetical protein